MGVPMPSRSASAAPHRRAAQGSSPCAATTAARPSRWKGVKSLESHLLHDGQALLVESTCSCIGLPQRPPPVPGGRAPRLCYPVLLAPPHWKVADSSRSERARAIFPCRKATRPMPQSANLSYVLWPISCEERRTLLNQGMGFGSIAFVQIPPCDLNERESDAPLYCLSP